MFQKIGTPEDPWNRAYFFGSHVILQDGGTIPQSWNGLRKFVESGQEAIQMQHAIFTDAHVEAVGDVLEAVPGICSPDDKDALQMQEHLKMQAENLHEVRSHMMSICQQTSFRFKSFRFVTARHHQQDI